MKLTLAPQDAQVAKSHLHYPEGITYSELSFPTYGRTTASQTTRPRRRNEMSVAS